MINPWVSVEKVAEHLGIRRDLIHRWIETKGPSAQRIGRMWKFKFSEVDDWACGGGTNNHDMGKRDGR